MKLPLLGLSLAALAVSACAAAAPPAPTAPACPVTPTVTETPPRDPNADPFGSGPWFVNADRSLWAQWNLGWQAGPDGNKVLWIRPAGAKLTVTGRRLDGDAPPLRADIPGGYPTTFQVSGVYLSEPGCWEITAEAGGRRLQFVAQIEAAAAPAAEPEPSQTAATSNADCPVSESVWVKPPEDSAVNDPPAFGYYFVNDDQSIWASAWWTGSSEYRLRAAGEGNKVGWFRPAGAALAITGERLDAAAPPLEAEAACCYQTRFQASGLYFPTEGCWRVTARAGESELTFVVQVYP